MQSEASRTIKIAKSYVIKSMLLAAAAGAIVPVGLLFFLFRLEGELFFIVLFSIAATFLMLVVVIVMTYRKAVNQSIHLYKDKIVFDYITLGSTFEFGDARSWTVVQEKNNWMLRCSKTGFIKRIPKSAFPFFKRETDLFY